MIFKKVVIQGYVLNITTYRSSLVLKFQSHIHDAPLDNKLDNSERRRSIWISNIKLRNDFIDTRQSLIFKFQSVLQGVPYNMTMERRLKGWLWSLRTSLLCMARFLNQLFFNISTFLSFPKYWTRDEFRSYFQIGKKTKLSFFCPFVYQTFL